MSGAELKLVGRLVVAHARQHPGRMLLTMFSTIAAACVVVWVVSGYDSLAEKFDEFAEEYMGRYQLLALPIPADGGQSLGGRNSLALSSEFVESLRRDPAVSLVDPIFETRLRIQKVGAAGDDEPQNSNSSPQGGVRTMGGRDQMRRLSRTPTLVGTNATEPPHTLLEGKWIDPKEPERMEAAITRDSAEQLRVKLGDELVVSRGFNEGEARVKIVGIVQQLNSLPPPKFMVGLPPSRQQALSRGPANAALYVPMSLAEKLSGRSAQLTFAGIVLKDGVKADEFRTNWAERFAKATPAVEVQSLEDVGDEVNNSTTFEGVRAQAYSATGISLLAALFIIFSTLSMGVDERIRQFAVLRAVSLTKAQVGAMIALESSLLGLIGWGGGLLAGWGLLKIMTHLRPEVFQGGASLGTWCIVLSGLCALGGSLAASVMPAWKATHVSPLDAMAIRQRTGSARFSWLVTFLGLLLIAVNPLVVFYVPMADAARYGISAAIGCVCMGIGFVLLAPLAIIVTEKVFGPLVARMMGLNPKLLATQLTTNLWRTLGSTIALTLGLGLFVAMQTWGSSMLGPYVPGNWTPDLVAGLLPLGIPESEIEKVRQVKGVVAEQCLPLAVEQVKFVDDVTGAKVRASSSRQDNCVIVGVDVDKALAGDRPMFDFTFIEGTRKEAIEKLKQGRYCLVPDHFQRESGLGVGSKFSVFSPEHPEQHIQYEIAGVVSMTGWHWMSKVGLRNHGGGRAAGLMFTSYDEVRHDYGIDLVTFFWMDLDGTATEGEVQASLQKIAQANFDPEAARARRRGRPDMAMMGGPGGGRGRNEATVNMRSADDVRKAITERADGIIWVLCQLPLVTLGVTSLGVINTVLSSIRARRWDMGVLRALGVTRFGLFRLIISEALLVGIVACILSLGFGVMAGYCGTGVTRYINIRGGQVTPLVIPWGKITIGFAITLFLCFIAALWPAISTGRAEPLRLLQAGRTAM